MDSICTNMINLPFNSVLDIEKLNHTNNTIQGKNNFMSSNNDFLADIDPVKNTLLNGLEKQCKNYDTSIHLNNNILVQDPHIAIIHMNICSSINKLRDLEYMLHNLKLNVYFIGLSETWATTMNQDILNIKCYNHEQCLRNNKKKGGGTSLYIHDSIHYRPRPDLSLPQKIFE